MADDTDIGWRPIERSDAAAWSAMLIDIQHADRDWEFLTEQDLLDDFGNPDHDFPRGSIGAFSGGVMAAFGTVRVRSEADPVHDMRYWGGVHLIGTRRVARGHGIASGLLARALAGAQAAGLVSGSLVVDADSPAGAVGLYERVGFTVKHTSVTQAKPLLPRAPG